ncbi:hypothetical protein SNE40_016517 [Patella caerulea]|uniref:Uncharacterized protein n=1 Tax=Patella caerulea TaxID=87958 RepID=A0AAN8JBN5_PATCE
MKGRYRIKECAETSQTIKQNTEHEKLRLKQTIRLLERSETTAISTITSNQKRLFRAFQAKIYHSKLFYARMWEDKNMERCLRVERTNYLHANLSDSEAEANFFKRLKKVPFLKDPRLVSASSRESSSGRDEEEDVIETVWREQPYSQGSPQHQYRRSSAPRVRAHNRIQPSLRPITAIGTDVDKEFNVLPEVPGSTTDEKFENYFGLMTNGDGGYQAGDKTEGANHGPKKSAVVSPGREDIRNFEQQNVRLYDYNDAATTVQSDTEGSKTNSLQIPTSDADNHILQRKHSMFNRGSKLSKVEKLLEANKTVDFKPRIRQFCESLEPLVVSDDQERRLDYYSYKIRAGFRDTENKILPQRTITPELIRRKYIGDIHVRNLTLNRLNFESNED